MSYFIAFVESCQLTDFQAILEILTVSLWNKMALFYTHHCLDYKSIEFLLHQAIMIEPAYLLFLKATYFTLRVHVYPTNFATFIHSFHVVCLLIIAPKI